MPAPAHGTDKDKGKHTDFITGRRAGQQGPDETNQGGADDHSGGTKTLTKDKCYKNKTRNTTSKPKLWLYKQRWQTAAKMKQSSVPVLPSLLSTAMRMLYRTLKVRFWNWWQNRDFFYAGEQGVDSRLPVRLPYPHSVVHHHIYWQNPWWQRATSQKGGPDKKRGGPWMALNVWKSSLPILAIKLKRQQAQTHESECDRIVEFSVVGTGSNQNQCLTFSVAGMTRSMEHEMNDCLLVVIGSCS